MARAEDDTLAEEELETLLRAAREVEGETPPVISEGEAAKLGEEIRARIAAHEARKASLRRDLERATRHKLDTSRRRDQFQAQYDERERQLAAVRKALAELQAERNDLKARAARIAEEQKAADSARSEAELALQDARAKAAQLFQRSTEEVLATNILVEMLEFNEREARRRLEVEMAHGSAVQELCNGKLAQIDAKLKNWVR